MEYQYLQIQLHERIGHIVLNRPEKRNAFNAELVTELKAAFGHFFEAPDCKIIVLRAKGEVFSAGADLGYLQQLQKNTYEENRADSRHLMELYEMIYTGPKVVISQVEGHAIAGGCGLATVTDFCFAVPAANFGYTEVRIGFIPAIVSVFLTRKIGEGKARELLLSGDLLTAAEALNQGLINFVVGADEIGERVQQFAVNMAKNCSGSALAMTKQLLADVQDLPYQAALALAADRNAQARATDDCQQGIGAFLNKEKIRW
ncbi:MAG: methylglutaconyl-CoA hydratase [Sphingobacteriaceae bacterium]|nr:methylglutaconyl-CoA hydratase [Sphingobacteriaceae bacterium]